MHQVLLIIICCCWVVAFGYAAASEKTITAESLVSDLQSNRRSVFAIGTYLSQLNLFVSGPGGSKTSGVYRVEVNGGEPLDGVFKVADSAIKPVATSALPGDVDVVFVCSDHIVVMKEKTFVGFLSIGSGSYNQTTNEYSYVDCFAYKDVLHLSTSVLLHFFFLTSKQGVVSYYVFDDINRDQIISKSTYCHDKEIKGVSQISYSDSFVTIFNEGDTVPFPRASFFCGYVGSSHVYLIDNSNSVHLFSANVFLPGGGSSSVTKVNQSSAWVVEKPATAPPVFISTPASEGCSGSLALAVIITIALVSLLFTAGIVVYCFCFAKLIGAGAGAAGKKDEKKGKVGSLKKGSSKKKGGGSSSQQKLGKSSASRRGSSSSKPASGRS